SYWAFCSDDCFWRTETSSCWRSSNCRAAAAVVSSAACAVAQSLAFIAVVNLSQSASSRWRSDLSAGVFCCTAFACCTRVFTWATAAGLGPCGWAALHWAPRPSGGAFGGTVDWPVAVGAPRPSRGAFGGRVDGPLVDCP